MCCSTSLPSPSSELKLFNITRGGLRQNIQSHTPEGIIIMDTRGHKSAHKQESEGGGAEISLAIPEKGSRCIGWSFL